MFGEQPNSSSGLLFGQELKKPVNPDNIQNYLMQKTHKNELSKAFTQSNLQKQIQIQRNVDM